MQKQKEDERKLRLNRILDLKPRHQRHRLVLVIIPDNRNKNKNYQYHNLILKRFKLSILPDPLRNKMVMANQIPKMKIYQILINLTLMVNLSHHLNQM